MYCDNCHRQSPGNFVNCPYCSAPLKNIESRKPQKFVKKKEHKKTVPFKTSVIAVIIVAFVLAVSAVVTGILTGSKPNKVVKTMVTAIDNNDADLYYSLYDEQIKEYYKENFYYGEEETFDALTSPLTESRDFYASKCGENFTLKYEIINIEYLSEERLALHNNTLATMYNYKRLPKKIAVLEIEIEAKGEKGAYKSVYSRFYCSQIKGKWYKLLLPTTLSDEESIEETQ